MSGTLVAMRALVATALVLALCVLAGCDGTPSAEPTTAAPTPSTTPLSDYSPHAEVAVSRSLFCDRVSPTAIEHAVGGPPESSRTWVNGDKTPTGQTGREYGCSWGTSAGGSAAAWVFAPPITRARAVALSKGPAGMKCRRTQSPLPFGDPSAAYSCGLNTGERMTELAGLFGDAWLTCQAPADAVDEFCGAILAAASSAAAS